MLHEPTDLPATPAAPSPAAGPGQCHLLSPGLRAGQDQVSTFSTEHGHGVHGRVAAGPDARVGGAQGVAGGNEPGFHGLAAGRGDMGSPVWNRTCSNRLAGARARADVDLLCVPGRAGPLVSVAP